MILELIATGPTTSKEIAYVCGISHSCASSSLARYWRQGLLTRSTAEWYNEKIYSITGRGFERLHFLRAKVFEEIEDERLDEFLANIKRCRIIRYDGATRTKVET
jgi:predicted transcriptional regulator